MLSFEHPSACTNLHWVALHARHGFAVREVRQRGALHRVSEADVLDLLGPLPVQDDQVTFRVLAYEVGLPGEPEAAVEEVHLRPPGREAEGLQEVALEGQKHPELGAVRLADAIAIQMTLDVPVQERASAGLDGPVPRPEALNLLAAHLLARRREVALPTSPARRCACQERDCFEAALAVMREGGAAPGHLLPVHVVLVRGLHEDAPRVPGRRVRERQMVLVARLIGPVETLVVGEGVVRQAPVAQGLARHVALGAAWGGRGARRRRLPLLSAVQAPQVVHAEGRVVPALGHQ